MNVKLTPKCCPKGADRGTIYGVRTYLKSKINIRHISHIWNPKPSKISGPMRHPGAVLRILSRLIWSVQRNCNTITHITIFEKRIDTIYPVISKAPVEITSIVHRDIFKGFLNARPLDQKGTRGLLWSLSKNNKDINARELLFDGPIRRHGSFYERYWADVFVLSTRLRRMHLIVRAQIVELYLRTRYNNIADNVINVNKYQRIDSNVWINISRNATFGRYY